MRTKIEYVFRSSQRVDGLADGEGDADNAGVALGIGDAIGFEPRADPASLEPVFSMNLINLLTFKS